MMTDIDWAFWITLSVCVIGAYLMLLAKIRQKGQRPMRPDLMRLYLRGYFLLLVAGGLMIVFGLKFCMPYFT